MGHPPSLGLLLPLRCHGSAPFSTALLSCSPCRTASPAQDESHTRPRRPWWSGAHATRFSWRPPVWGIPHIQKDIGPQGLTAQPLRASPPRQPETVPAGTAKFVICDHTIEFLF